MSRPTLYYMIGYPGAGKSTFASQFAVSRQALHLSADTVAFGLFTAPTFSLAERQLVLEEMERQATEALRNQQDVIYDLCSYTSELREQHRAVAQQSNASAIGIWIKTPLEVARSRALQVRIDASNSLRRVTAAQFDSIAVHFEHPSENEDVIILAGTQPFDLQLKALEAQYVY